MVLKKKRENMKIEAFTLERLENVENISRGLLVRLVKGLLRRFFSNFSCMFLNPNIFFQFEF